MKTTTAFKKREAALTRIRDRFNAAKIYKPTSKHIHSQVLEIMEDVKSCPGWVRDYIRGYYECLFDSLWQHMEFCYEVNGVLYTTNRNSDKPHWDTLPDYNMKGKLCAHYWFGTDKPYTSQTEA